MWIAPAQTLMNQHVAAQNDTRPVPLPVPVICGKTKDQPIDPVEMNSGIYRPFPNFVETLHVEKEIFACHKLGAPTGSIFKYVDITLFTRIFPLESGATFIPTFWGVNATVCERDLSGDILSCTSPTIPIVDNPPLLTQCTEQTPILPLEVNTLFSDDLNYSLPLKSVIAEKHSYNCAFGNVTVPNKIKETILFTFNAQVYDPHINMKFSYANIECVKDIRSSKIDSCSQTFEQLAP